MFVSYPVINIRPNSRPNALWLCSNTECRMFCKENAGVELWRVYTVWPQGYLKG